MFLIYVNKKNTPQPKKVKINFTPAIPSDVQLTGYARVLKMN